MEFFAQIQEAFAAADTSGIQDLIFGIFKMINEGFDLRTVDTETLAKLLTQFAPIWNPIWELVNKFLANAFNF